MFHSKYKIWLVNLLLFSFTLVFIMPALAGTATWSGTIGNGRVFDSTNSGCVTSISSRNYHVQRFYVDVSGNYNIEILSASGFPTTTDDAMFALYTPFFDPSAYATNCIAQDDDTNGLLPVITGQFLTAGVAYDIVVFNSWANLASTPGGVFTGEISGPGNICFGSPCDSSSSSEGTTSNIVYPPDERINWQFGDLGAVLYLNVDNTGNPAIDVYCYDGENAFFGMQVSEANASNGMSADGCDVSFYILSDGGYQFNINYDGKLYEIECADFDCRPPDMRYYDPNE